MALFGGNAIVAALLAGVMALAGYSYFKGVQSGSAGVVAKIERNDNAAAGKIRKADDLSRQSGPGSVRKHVRDPNTVSE